jgi:hypothetical protein
MSDLTNQQIKANIEARKREQFEQEMRESSARQAEELRRNAIILADIERNARLFSEKVASADFPTEVGKRAKYNPIHLRANDTDEIAAWQILFGPDDPSNIYIAHDGRIFEHGTRLTEIYPDDERFPLNADWSSCTLREFFCRRLGAELEYADFDGVHIFTNHDFLNRTIVDAIGELRT